MKAKKNKNENDAIAWMKRMSVRVRKKKRQVIEWEDSTINISKDNISPRKL